jgi:Ca2+/Na+ antiporter
MSWRDRTIGIVLGLVIGVAAVILLVFLGGAGNIDAPSIDQSSSVERSVPTEGDSPGAVDPEQRR